MSHAWTCHDHAYEWVMSCMRMCLPRIAMSPVSHVKESCSPLALCMYIHIIRVMHIFAYVTWLIHMWLLPYVCVVGSDSHKYAHAHMHIYDQPRCVSVCVWSVDFRIAVGLLENALFGCYTCQWVMSHVRMSHSTHKSSREGWVVWHLHVTPTSTYMSHQPAPTCHTNQHLYVTPIYHAYLPHIYVTHTCFTHVSHIRVPRTWPICVPLV